MLILKSSRQGLARIFREAARRGEPAIFPTDTVYGMGAPLSAVAANRAIFEIKQRQPDKPFPVLAGSMEQVLKIADVENLAFKCAGFLKKWPGPYTFLLKARPNLDALYVKDGSVAVRIPAEERLRNALTDAGEPVTATSANKSGFPVSSLLTELVKIFGNRISLYAAGRAGSGSCSVIYDLRGAVPLKIR